MRRGDAVASGRLVRLRAKRPDDARRDWEWRRDGEVAELDAVPVTRLSYEEYRQQYRWQLRSLPAYKTMFAIETADGRHIGNLMYYNIDRQRRDAEIGIIIGERDYWGAGYGTEAVSLLVDHIFTATPLTRVYLHTLDWNLRAQKAFARAGFRDCAVVRRGPNRFHQMELRREWLWDRDYQRRAASGGATSSGGRGKSGGARRARR